MPDTTADTDALRSEEQIYREIAWQEAIRSEVTEWMEPDADGPSTITLYADDLPLLQLMEKTAKRLAKSNEEPTQEVQGTSGTVAIRPTQTGKALIELCDAFDPGLQARHRHHAFNPWIQAMWDALCQWYTGSGFGKPFPEVGIAVEDRDNLGHMARFVRRMCQSQVFRRRLQGEQRLARQNYRSACTYLMWLFAHHSRLLILRVDLYYRGVGKEWADTEEAQVTFERFLRVLRLGHIVPDVLGCLFSREVGPERGVHFHVMVILDGHKRKDANGYTQALGERWIKDYAGAARGTYFNCYARRNEYEYNGLGLVHVSDWRKLMGIRLALRYMTKAEYLIEPKGGGKRNFRRGLVKQIRVKQGAPRQADHEMSAVWRILGG